MARRLWHNAKVIVRIAVLPVGMAAAVLAFIALIAASNTATAQVAGQTTVMYKVLPETEKRVSVITEGANKGFLSYIGKTPATITASIVGISGVYTGAAITFSAQVSLRALTVTIRALASCDISGGCDAFGLGTASGGAAGRLSVFMTTGLSTISMYIASGAKLNEEINNDYLLAYALASANLTMHLSALVAGGANINMTGRNGTALAYAVTARNTMAISVLADAGIDFISYMGAVSTSTQLSMLLAVGGRISINATSDNGTALHYAVSVQNTTAISLLLDAEIDDTIADASDRTPWHLAVFLHHQPESESWEDIIPALFNNGATGINHITSLGTPALYAQSYPFGFKSLQIRRALSILGGSTDP